MPLASSTEYVLLFRKDKIPGAASDPTAGILSFFNLTNSTTINHVFKQSVAKWSHPIGEQPDTYEVL